MFIPFSFLVFLVLLEEGCLHSNNTETWLKIAGGEPADIEDFPYQVAIHLDGDLCGGTILNAEHILTAAHCTAEYSPSDITIRAGSNIRNEGGVVVRAEEIFQHPQFDPDSYENDIAIIKLASALNFDVSVNSIDIPIDGEPIECNRVATVTGYGWISDHGPFSEELQKVELPVICTSDCQNIYQDQITEEMFCAGFSEGGKDACPGDSGGPLVLDGKVIGVVSFGPDCAAPGMPGVYTKVSSFISFIDSVINE